MLPPETFGDEEIPVWAARYPQGDISAGEFEQFVFQLLGSAAPTLTGFRVTSHESVKGVDGTYDFDATVRFSWSGMDFLIVVEAKRHTNPIKRDMVQVLHHKALSVGAHKAVLISTARFQRGALELARVHGIALATVTEGRYTIVTRAAIPTPPLSREKAADLGVPAIVAVYFGLGDSPDSWSSGTLDADSPDQVRELLLGVSRDGSM